MNKYTLLIRILPFALFSQNANSYKPTKIIIQDNVERYLWDYTQTDNVGLNEMYAPVGWTEPIIEAEFHIRGIVLSGSLGLQFKDSIMVIVKNNGFYIPKGERVRIFNSGEEELILIEVLTPAYKQQRVRQFDHFH